jgi:hypothetical protein
MQHLRQDGADYQPKGASQLLPKDLRCLCRYLLSSQSIVRLQTWVMILLACKMFLRPDKVVTIQLNSFIPELNCQKGNNTIGMLCKVKGKQDGRIVHLWIWADDECPDLCPVRHLLVYLFKTKHKGGPLFPTATELLQRKPENWNGLYTTQVSYDSFREDMTKLYNECLFERNLKVGLQMFRKTAYLLGIWGDGKWASLKQSGRHQTESSADLYKKDAETLKLIDNVFKDKENRVSTWIPIYCEAPSQATYLNLESSAFALPLYDLA